jgi:hypothetical protein
MNPETKQKWIEWLSAFRPHALVVVFKGDELLLKTHDQHVSIGIYGEVTYTLYRPELKGVWSQAIGREAFVTITWSEDDQSPVYGIDKANIIVYPTRTNAVEDGTVIIDFYRNNVEFKLRWTDFTDIIAFTTDAITVIYPLNWAYPDEYEKPAFAIDVYDEKIPLWHDDIINKIMSEPHNYLSPELKQQLEQQRKMRRQHS